MLVLSLSNNIHHLGFLYKCWIKELKILPLDHSDPRMIQYMQLATFSNENCIFLTETGKGYYCLDDVTKRIA
jgi:hypothetical protein